MKMQVREKRFRKFFDLSYFANLLSDGNTHAVGEPDANSPGA